MCYMINQNYLSKTQNYLSKIYMTRLIEKNVCIAWIDCLLDIFEKLPNYDIITWMLLLTPEMNGL